MVIYMNYSEQLYILVERELGEVGRYVLEKQCRDLNIDPSNIEKESLPRLSRIFFGLMSRFGDDKAKRISVAINSLRAGEPEEEEPKEFVCPLCDTPASADDNLCRNCGAKFGEDEGTPKLFSEDAGRTGRGKNELTIVDVSKRFAKKE